MGRGSGFVRAHAKFGLALLNVAVAATGIQIASARVAESPGKLGAAAAVSVADDVSRLQALRLDPSAVARARALAPPPAAVSVPASSAQLAGTPIAGKGMWIWLFNLVEGGDPQRIIGRARQLGLSHIYVRSSSTTGGLKFLPDIDAILPVAHAAGIKVIAWDFPTLRDPGADAHRMIAVLDHHTRSGDRVDGIAVDLETAAEGVHLSERGAHWMAMRLHQLRPDRFRILVPPRPTNYTKRVYPYGIIRDFDAVAPMVYWISRNPVALVRESIGYLKRYGKPIAPIGQAYDPAEDGGPKGAPPGHVLTDFAEAARRAGAVGVSFWSWQHATLDELRAIAALPFPIPQSPIEESSHG